ncbi:MAG: hypothetical protein K2O18_16415 [Oscillospiraceae bacterium]|nr:hypothetical protein [Oscillospiraceae bacterium]
MGKKHKCRMTPEEIAIHEEAVRLRRMSDKQLVEEFHRSKDADNASKPADGPNEDNNASLVETLLQGLSDGKCKGVGGATAYKVAQFAAEMGLV